jgi:hypothetical protein
LFVDRYAHDRGRVFSDLSNQAPAAAELAACLRGRYSAVPDGLSFVRLQSGSRCDCFMKNIPHRVAIRLSCRTDSYRFS